MKVKINKLPKSEVEIEGELGEEIFETYFARALKKLGGGLEIPGFRKGKAPENILLANLSEMKILEEMATLALGDAYPKILEENKIEAIGRPEIAITKLARNNPLGFKIKTAVLPPVVLPDYKKIAKRVRGEIPEKDKNATAPEKEKENQAREETRLKIIEEIIKESKIDLPEILAEIELDKIFYKMESDITQMGLKFEDYLKHLNKTREDLVKEVRPDAEKKAKLGLILNEIAKIEKLIPDPEQVSKEVAQILEHYKDADPERAKIHAENVLTNEKVFILLENF